MDNNMVITGGEGWLQVEEGTGEISGNRNNTIK